MVLRIAGFLGWMLLASGCLNPLVQQKITGLEEKIRQEPTNAAAHRDLGRTWLEAGQFREAARHLMLAVKLDPQDRQAFYLLGLAYTRLGEYENAVRVMAAGRRMGGPPYEFTLGMALLGAGQKEEGVQALKRAIRQDPALAQVYRFSTGQAQGETPPPQPGEIVLRDEIMREALEDVLDSMKEELRQEVQEQIAESLILD